MSEQSPPPLLDADALAEQHRSYVRALAVEIKQTLPPNIDLEDLIAYGQVGLLEAARRFDPRRGVAFTTFSYYRIKGAIYDGLREMGYFSRGARAHQAARFAAHADALLQSAADDEGARAETTGSIPDDIAAVQSLIDGLIPAYLLSLGSDQVPDVADPNATAAEQIERADVVGLVLRLVTELPDDEQQLLDLIYFKHVSMTDVAARLGISKSWVSRLHARAIKHLRGRLEQRGVLHPP